MSAMYGADPEQLAALGRTLRQQMATIDTVVRTVTSALGGTAWTGPARDRFEQEWQQSFRSALARLGDAFDLAGGDCIARSTDLQRVLGAR